MMNYKEMKIRTINNKMDAIIFLNQLIGLTEKRMTRLENALNDVEKLMTKYKNHRKIETTIYQAYQERMDCVTMYLCNIFGDETKNAASYKQFRKIMDRKYSQGYEEFKLEPLSKDMVEILEDLREQRNWSHHIPQSLFTSQENYMINKDGLSNEMFKRIFSNKTVYVSVWKYHDIKWLRGLYDSAKEAYDIFNTVFEQMKSDYSKLIGTDMNIQKVDEPRVRPFEFVQIAEDSMKANSKRR